MAFLDFLFGPPDFEALVAKRDINQLTKLLKYKKISDVRRKAAIALGQIGSTEAIESLIKEIGNKKDSDSDTEFTNILWAALGNIGEPAADSLFRLINDPDENIRKKAAFTLSNIGDARALNLLITIFESSNPEDRYDAVHALGRIGNPSSVDVLRRAIKDPESAIGVEAVRALGKVGGDKVIEALISAFKDQDPLIKYAAADELEKLNWQPENKDLRISFEVALKKWGKLIDEGNAAVEPLLSLLVNSRADVKLNVIKTLGRIRDTRAVLPLIAELNNSNDDVKLSAVTALGQIGDHQAVEPLIEMINKSSLDLRQNIIVALVTIGEQSVMPLISALENVYKKALESANMLIKYLDSKSLDRHLYIREVYWEPWQMWLDIVDALGQIGDEKAVRPLVLKLGNWDSFFHGSYDSSAEYRYNTLNSIASIDVNKKDEFRKLDNLREWSVKVKQATAKALVNIGEPAVPELVSSLIGKNGLYIGWDALVEIGEPSVIPLINMLQFSDSDIREGSARALSRIGDVRALTPLLKATQQDAEIPDDFLEPLAHILEASASKASKEELIKIINCENRTALCYKKHACTGFEKYNALIDYSFVKQLARQELISRGEKI